MQRGRAPTGDAAGWSGWAVATVVKRNSAKRPLSVEAVECSPKMDVIAGREIVSSGAGGVAPAVVADFPVPTGAG